MKKLSEAKSFCDLHERYFPELIFKHFDERSDILQYRPSFEGDEHQLERLLTASTTGVASIWNDWRQEAHVPINLRGADLSHANLRDLSLHQADLTRANLNFANLTNVNLFCSHLDEIHCVGARFDNAKIDCASMVRARAWEADFSNAIIHQSDLASSSCANANFTGAHIEHASFMNSDLRGARFRLAALSSTKLIDANLSWATLVATDVTGSDFTGASIYGISAWDVIMDAKLKQTKMEDLVITPDGEPEITVDNLEVAQFIYLLLNNEKIRASIDTIGKRAVLILGRFTPQRKAILDAIKGELRNRKYVPILFDFQKPNSRDTTETISTLAHLSRFVIADITDAKSIPQELQAIVPNLPSVTVQPILGSAEDEYGMFEHFRRYPWVLPLYRYGNRSELIARFGLIIEAMEAALVARG